MNLDNIFSTKITILKKSKSGKILQKVVTSNAMTYTGADLIAKALAQRGAVDINLLHLRYAQNESDAFATGTEFGPENDIKKVAVPDFEDTTGTAGGSVVELTETTEPLPTSVNYQGNQLTFNFSMSIADLSPAFAANTSYVYCLGLGVPDTSSPYSSEFTTGGIYVFSALKLDESDRFTISGGQQIDVAYDITVSA